MFFLRIKIVLLFGETEHFYFFFLLSIVLIPFSLLSNDEKKKKNGVSRYHFHFSRIEKKKKQEKFALGKYTSTRSLP